MPCCRRYAPDPTIPFRAAHSYTSPSARFYLVLLLRSAIPAAVWNGLASRCTARGKLQFVFPTALKVPLSDRRASELVPLSSSPAVRTPHQLTWALSAAEVVRQWRTEPTAEERWARALYRDELTTQREAGTVSSDMTLPIPSVGSASAAADHQTSEPDRSIAQRSTCQDHQPYAGTVRMTARLDRRSGTRCGAIQSSADKKRKMR